MKVAVPYLHRANLGHCLKRLADGILDDFPEICVEEYFVKRVCDFRISTAFGKKVVSNLLYSLLKSLLCRSHIVLRYDVRCVGNILRISRIAAALGFNEQAIAVQLIHSKDAMIKLVVLIHKVGILLNKVMVVKRLGYELCKGSCGHFHHSFHYTRLRLVARLLAEQSCVDCKLIVHL